MLFGFKIWYKIYTLQIYITKNGGEKLITLEDIKNNTEVKELVKASQKGLNALGYTEHASRHIGIVAYRAGKVLEELRISKW